MNPILNCHMVIRPVVNVRESTFNVVVKPGRYRTVVATNLLSDSLGREVRIDVTVIYRSRNKDIENASKSFELLLVGLIKRMMITDENLVPITHTAPCEVEISLTPCSPFTV